jgi:NAD(P)-dependent dehydrogenase (short-subunit alcohol dehydrogenase family)
MQEQRSRQRLNDKIAIVTGAGSGLGRVSAAMFAVEGAKVICADINLASAQECAQEIIAAGNDATAVHVDISDERSAQQLAAHTIEQHGRIDILMHSAGISSSGTALNTDRATWDRIMAVNLTGTWLMCKAVLPFMIERKRGSIVTVSSLAGITGLPDKFSYSTAKAGMVGMTQQMAAEYAPEGIRINTICPGTIITPMSLAVYEKNGFSPQAALAKIGERYPLKRPGTQEGVAYLALYLASDEAEFYTGHAVPYEGGITAIGWLAGK